MRKKQCYVIVATALHKKFRWKDLINFEMNVP